MPEGQKNSNKRRIMNLIQRRAKITDLKEIVSLLADDKLGKTREKTSDKVTKNYIDAFHKIDSDPNQYLMVFERDKEIIGTCHLTLMPSLTFIGRTRLQIEAVRVRADARGAHIGHKMIELAIHWGKKHGAKIFQLTTHKERSNAIRFYEKLGFNLTHAGMKLYLESA